MASFTGSVKIIGTISLGILTVLLHLIMSLTFSYQGALATTSFITVPAVVTIASNGNANQSLSLVRRRVNMMTAICGTISISSLSLAFLFGKKHLYLVYATIGSAMLLRHQREALLQLGLLIKQQYYIGREFISEYVARKSNKREKRPFRAPVEPRLSPSEPLLPPQEVEGALEQLGASSLANCLVSGVAFGIATIGVFGDVDSVSRIYY